LRGIAAALVMLFHYTTRFQELYGHPTAPSVTVPWGFYGVNLFFMISGFVIFMTLERTRRPLDFVVSRFSRLYPAYWVAVALTFGIVACLGLPGKEVGPGTALLNALMFHGLFRIEHVDSVYWTLEVELLFYAWALLLYRVGWLRRVHIVLAAALALRLVYFVSDRFFQVDLPYIVYRLTILQYIPWFACGVMVYRLTRSRAQRPRDLTVLVGAIAVLAVVESPGVALLAVALTVVLAAAARARAPLLNTRPLVGLGAISYTLYLLHENIGWAALLRLERAGVPTDVAILAVILLILVLATLLTLVVERPAMAWIRARYRRARIPAPPPDARHRPPDSLSPRP
jgi:peptidoglycan/LPS O-acetylase OafA/YrhL